MRLAETVTFGGSGLDRAGGLRADAAALDTAASGPASRHLPLWRGKPLLVADGDGAERPGWVDARSPVLEGAGTRVFLGLDRAGANGAAVACFAHDVSGWAPEEMPATLGAFADPSEQHPPGVPPGHRYAELRACMTRLGTRDAELVATARGLLGWHGAHGFCARCGTASEAAEGGWRRACPACRAQHFPRTDPVVIMLVTSGNSVLLGRAPGWPPRMYSLLAGFVEPGETVESAVRRETFEETGVRVGAVGYLASQPWPFPASLMLGCRGDALSRDITCDPAEIEDALWLSREDMTEVMTGRHSRVDPPRDGAIARFLLMHWLSDTLG